MPNFVKHKIKTLIIGAGQIGAFADGPQSESVLTHAHAVNYLNDKFSLLGFVEPNQQARETATSAWGGKGYKNLADFKATKTDVDLVVIASPDNSHLDFIQESLNLNSRGIIVEKPLCLDLADFEKQTLSTKNSSRIMVNYTRRYLSNYQNFWRLLETQEFGRFLQGSGIYSKGLFHSGSHLINAILPIMDRNILEIQNLGKRNDYIENDPTIDCIIKFQDGSYFNLFSTDANIYEIFEIDLFFEKARIRMDKLGNRISYTFPQRKGESKINYLIESQKSEEQGRHEAFLNLYTHAHAVLMENHKIICGIEDSFKTLKICDQIRKTVK